MTLKSLPLWSCTLIMIASLVTGAVISVSLQSLGLVYHICFVLAALATVLFVSKSYIFLAVSQIPILFAIVTPIAQWSVADALASDAQKGQISKTSVIAAGYSLVSNFPVLLLVTLITIALGFGRYYLAVRSYRAAAKVADSQAEAAKSSQESTATAVRARTRRSMEARPGQLTVDDLIKQRRERTAAATKARREQRARETNTQRAQQAEREARQQHEARREQRPTSGRFPVRKPDEPRSTTPTAGRFKVVSADDPKYQKRTNTAPAPRFQVRKPDEA
ncbi:MAG: hypothetical protein Q3962_00360 [Corynebacterium sp.]|nr:hypothetical protein [Corynebacterium sp.]